MKTLMTRTFVPGLLLIIGFAALGAQSTHAGSLKARFSSDGDAQAFAAWAEFTGQGNAAMITHNADGSTTVILPDVAMEKMADTALDAIDAHANAIQVGPPIPDPVIDAIGEWFDGFQAEGNTALVQTDFTDGFEYSGDVSGASIGFDRSFLEGNTFFAYRGFFTIVIEITALDPLLEEPIKAAIQAEAAVRGIPVIPYP